MSSPTELRQASQTYRWVAEHEPDPHLKRRLAGHAFHLAQLAEKIERDEAARMELTSAARPASDPDPLIRKEIACEP